MTDCDIPQFLALDEAAKLLNVARSTLTQAIDTGKLPAIRLGETHGATRIRRSDLLSGESTARDWRTQRLRRLQLEAMRAREAAQRAEAAAIDARRVADLAARAVDDELALSALETTERRLIAS